MSWRICLIVAAGGAMGTIGRFLLASWAAPISQSLPWGTILINIAGSFVIGFFGTLTLAEGRHPLGEEARLFVMVGMCGGFTTFSSFSLQTLDLMRTGAIGRATVNIVVSVLLCVAAVAAGHYLAARLNGGATQITQIEAEKSS